MFFEIFCEIVKVINTIKLIIEGDVVLLTHF